MGNNLRVFEGSNVEVFEFDGKVLFNPKDVAKILEFEDSTVRKAIAKMTDKQVVKVTNSVVKDIHIRKLNNAGENFLTESGVYKLVMRSNKPEAERFQDWVTDEVLPSIRKTGGYVGNDDMFINTYLPFADDTTKTLFKTTLHTVRLQNETIKKQQEEIEHKQEIIHGFVDDVDIYTKIDIVNRIIKRNSGGNYGGRYNEMYQCFKETYHVDLKARCEGYNMKQTKKKDHLSIIKYAEKFNYMDDLYKVACRLYESEVNEMLDRLRAS